MILGDLDDSLSILTFQIGLGIVINMKALLLITAFLTQFFCQDRVILKRDVKGVTEIPFINNPYVEMENKKDTHFQLSSQKELINSYYVMKTLSETSV